MSGNDDLFKALDMFKSGVKELQFSRAIASANDQVQQIKAAEGNEQQKRAQLQDLSNQLVTHMAGMGTPATTIAAVQGAIAPKTYTNANAMSLDAQLTGNTSLAAEAKAQQDFEEDPLKKRLAMQLQKVGSMHNEERALESNQKTMSAWGDKLEPALASSRSAFGQMANTIGGVKRLQAVAGDPSQWSNLTDAQFTLMAEGAIKAVKGGVGTEPEIKSLIPPNKSPTALAARLKELATNDPQGLGAQKWAQMLMGVVDREVSENRDMQETAILQHARAGLTLATDKRKLGNGETQLEDYKRKVAAAFTAIDQPTSPDEVIIDPKKGLVTTAAMQQADKAETLIKQAYVAARSKKATPEERAQAGVVFQSFGIDPNMPIPEAVKNVRSGIKTKRIQF